ncbi:polyamine ABC transporter substrate-binding protein [Pseudomonas sp. J452]|uniref:polyamine ABC transporter substrate-binding protein n=1 Tax=Pseudomonas sp. J452 TaxID=2898441 RepID=UPI0021ADC0C2|nr:polyamine ABC transporter substrate-binding protein [Pseudomonas sp. J452]UUY08168.1 polyamine ABC transporter substrate-binding protein [Pseudomonas sp. J452]
MNFPRSLQLSLVALCGLALGPVQAAEPVVHLYNWYDFIGPEVTKDFARDSGIQTLLDTFDSGEVLTSKLLTGRSGYDVVVVTDSLLPNLIKAGVLAELPREQLPNWQRLDGAILDKLQSNDPDNRHAVPYLWGTTGIGYDQAKVKAALGDSAPVDSWELIFKEDNLAKLSQCGVAMLDAPGEIIPIALHYLGLPPNSRNPADYKQAEALLAKVRPHIRYFDSSKFITDLSNGDICVVLGWGGGVFEAQKNAKAANNGRDIRYSIPREGAPVWMESLVLLKDAPHPQQGLALIDYLMRALPMAATSNHVGYPNANLDASPLVDAEIRNNPGVYPSAEVMATLFTLEPLPLKVERVRTRTWNKIKTGS